MGKQKTQEQIVAAFETWQSVFGLKFKRVEPDEECEKKITFLHNHDGLNCPYKLSGQKGGTLANAFYLGKSAISGDIHFDSENWTEQKTVPGDGKYNLFSVAVHELGHALGLYHNTEDKDNIMQPIFKSGFSNKTLSESDIKTIQEMYGAAKNVIVMAIFNSKQAKVMIRKILQSSKTKRLKIIYTLKPKHFSENLEISDESFQSLLKKLTKIDHDAFVAEICGVIENV